MDRNNIRIHNIINNRQRDLNSENSLPQTFPSSLGIRPRMSSDISSFNFINPEIIFDTEFSENDVSFIPMQFNIPIDLGSISDGYYQIFPLPGIPNISPSLRRDIALSFFNELILIMEQDLLDEEPKINPEAVKQFRKFIENNSEVYVTRYDDEECPICYIPLQMTDELIYSNKMKCCKKWICTKCCINMVSYSEMCAWCKGNPIQEIETIIIPLK